MSVTVHPTPTRVRPSVGRRVAVFATGVLACLLPVVFAVTISRMLLTGELADHRFHQLTGQGLVLVAVWLGGLVPLIRAGWHGRRPSTAAGLLHLSFVGVGALCSIAAPGGGAPVLMGIIAVTGALVWVALPSRPALRGSLMVDPVLTPLVLVLTAAYTPYALSQISLQNAATGHHAENPHYFDMAWLVLVLVVVGALAAAMPAARSLALWSGGCAAAIGVAGLVLGTGLPWLAVAGLAGLALAGAAVLLRPVHEAASTPAPVI